MDWSDLDFALASILVGVRNLLMNKLGQKA